MTFKNRLTFFSSHCWDPHNGSIHLLHQLIIPSHLQLATLEIHSLYRQRFGFKVAGGSDRPKSKLRHSFYWWGFRTDGLLSASSVAGLHNSYLISVWNGELRGWNMWVLRTDFWINLGQMNCFPSVYFIPGLKQASPHPVHLVLKCTAGCSLNVKSTLLLCCGAFSL